MAEAGWLNVCEVEMLSSVFYLIFYISIYFFFPHADCKPKIGGWIGQDEQAGQRPMHAEPHNAVMPRPFLTQPQP